MIFPLSLFPLSLFLFIAKGKPAAPAAKAAAKTAAPAAAGARKTGSRIGMKKFYCIFLYFPTFLHEIQFFCLY